MDRGRRNDHRRSDGGRKLCCCGGVRRHQERFPHNSCRRKPGEGYSFDCRLERFPSEVDTARVKKTRQNKRPEPGSDSIRTDKALRGTTFLRLSNCLRPEIAVAAAGGNCKALSPSAIRPKGRHHRYEGEQ